MSSNLVTVSPVTGWGYCLKEPHGVIFTIPPSGWQYTGHSSEVEYSCNSFSFLNFFESGLYSSRLLLLDMIGKKDRWGNFIIVLIQIMGARPSWSNSFKTIPDRVSCKIALCSTGNIRNTSINCSFNRLNPAIIYRYRLKKNPELGNANFLYAY